MDMSLQIKVGHRYRTRSGDVVEIQRNRGKAYICCFVGFVQGIGIEFFTLEGNHRGDGYESELDLIEEIPAPVAEAADTLDFKIEYESPTISAVRPEPPRMDASLTATEGPATEKVVLHWDREGVTGYTSVGQQPRSNADDAWLHANLADTRAGITRKYAQAAMFVMLGVAAIIFAIGTSVQV